MRPVWPGCPTTPAARPEQQFSMSPSHPGRPKALSLPSSPTGDCLLDSASPSYSSSVLSSLSSVSSGEVSSPPPTAHCSFDPDAYLGSHKAAVEERYQLGPGKSNKMHKLFRYWHDFLVDNFNQPMYTSFMRLAEEDAADGVLFGVQLLFSFYRIRLAKYYDLHLLNDFEVLAHKFVDYLSYWPGMILLLDLCSSGDLPPDAGIWDRKTASKLRGQITALMQYNIASSQECVQIMMVWGGGHGGNDGGNGHHYNIRLAQLAAGARRRHRRHPGMRHSDSGSSSVTAAPSLRIEHKKELFHNYWQHRPAQQLKHGREKQQLVIMHQLRARLGKQHEGETYTHMELVSSGLPDRLGETLGD